MATGCPFCNTRSGQYYRGERYNPLTGHSHNGEWRCERCLCEYTVKASGVTVITASGLSDQEVFTARHTLAIEETAALVEAFHSTA